MTTKNRNQLRSTVTDDVDISQFLPGFVADLPKIVSHLAAIMDECNFQELKGVLHQLKGVGGLYGFMPITDSAENAEQLISDTPDIQSVARGVQSLIGLIRRVEGYDRTREARLAEKSLA